MDYDEELMIKETEKKEEKEKEKEKEKEEEEEEIKGENKRLLIINISIFFLSYLIFFAIYPFLSLTMTDCGLDSFYIGAVTASYPLGMFFASIFTGYILPIFGARNLLLFSMGIGAIAIVFFGLIPKISCHPDQGDGLSIFLFIFLRFIQGMAGGCVETTVMYVQSSVFEKNLGKILAYQELAVGLSAMIGPIVGGILYELVGFFYTLAVFAVFNIALLFILFAYYPSSISSNESLIEGEKEGLLSNKGMINVSEGDIKPIEKEKSNFSIEISFSDIVSFPLLCTYGVLFMYNYGFTLMMPFYPLYLSDEFGYGSIISGSMIGATALSYALVSFGVGTAIDSLEIKKTGTLKLYMGFGLALQALAYWLLGPIPLQSVANIYSLIIGMVLLGISSGFLIIPTLPDAQLCAAITRDDSPEVKSLVSGIWQAAYSLSSVVGGLVGGVLYGEIGFQGNCFVVAILFVISGVFVTVYALYTLHSKSKY